MNYRYLSIFLILMILSIGAVSAQENTATDGNVSNVKGVSSEVVITDDSYSNYFNSTTGKILENSGISDGSTIKIGNVTNKIFSIDKNLTIISTSSNEILTNASFSFVSGSAGSTIGNLTINCNNAKSNVFNIEDSDITIQENIIKLVGAENIGDIYVVYAQYAENLKILYNTINFTGRTNGTAINNAIRVIGSESVKISSNTFEINIPGGDVNWGTGFGSTEGIVFDKCDALEFSGNNITVSANEVVGSYPTVFAVHIGDSDNVNVLNNEIYASGDITYIYGFKVGGDNFFVSENKINVDNENYGAWGIEIAPTASGIIDSNYISVSSNNVSYGVYASFDWYTGDCPNVNYTNNYIEVESYATYAMELFGSGVTVIDVNKIYAYGDYTLGISTFDMTGGSDPFIITNNDIFAQGLKDGEFNTGDMVTAITVVIFPMWESQIQNNAITSAGNWTIINTKDSEITDNYLVSKDLLGDDSVDDRYGATVKDNIPVDGATNYVLTNDTFFLFFDSEGNLRENITSESLTFKGEFSNIVNSIIISRPIKLLSDNAVLHEVGLLIVSDNVTVDGFAFISKLLPEVISVYGVNNVSIINNKFSVEGLDDDDNSVIDIDDSDIVVVDNNTILFGVFTNGTFRNVAITADGSNSLSISNNNITASLPSRSINWTSGTVYSEGVCLNDCDGAFLFNNTIGIKSNDKQSTYDTIYTIHIVGDDAVVERNKFGTVEAPYGYGLVIAGDNFQINNNEIYVGENETYSCGIDVESNSDGIIDDNIIVTVGVSSYGIYTANWAGDVKANITNNVIVSNGTTVFGMSLSGSEATVDNNVIIANGNFTSGIASAVSNITIVNNTITANGSNVGTPAGYDSMGIKTIGVHVVSGDATVTGNNITSNSKYAVEIGSTGTVTGNELYAEVLTGDFAVNYTQGYALVANNTPEMILDYIVTNDTFYIYFDEEGKLREQITADNLTFFGEFSNLVDKIIIETPIALLSYNATLYDMGIEIQAEYATVDGFTFISDKLSEIITVYSSDSVSIINNDFTVKGLNDTENAVIIVMDSDDVVLDNNSIIFSIETNGTFRNAAIYADGSDDLIISNSTITAYLPSRSINWTSGTVYSEGVCLNDCDGAVLFNNNIGVKSNDKQSDYDTIYAVHIIGDDAVVEKNNIGAVEAPYGYGLVIAGDNFEIDSNMIYVGENETYSCGIDVESNSAGVINDNMIVTVGESSYGIYTANWAGDVKANITNNVIVSNGTTVFGMSLSGSEATVENNTVLQNGNYTTGIASAVSNITIVNNRIEANGSNVGTPAGYDSMGIETTGIHLVSGKATATGNNVTTTGEFAVDVKEGTSGQVTDNYLVAKELTGDASVNYVPSQTIMVDGNIPPMEKVFISADDVVMYYKNGTGYVVTLTDSVGAPLANKKVTITINGVNYTRTTNENGTASMALNLNSGNYSVSAAYDGESGLGKASVENNITILSTVYGDDLVKVFRNASQYYATFLDGQGNPLAEGTDVKFNINGVMYIRKTNSNGTAKLNINLEQGTYIITAINPVNGEMHANNITVLSTITNNSDLVKYYRNASQYVVTLVGEDGKAVGAGENVTFNINGVFYTRTTNATGQAKLNINLNPGNYTITAEYKKCKVANNIEVKPVLFAEDKVIKQGTSDQFRAKLLDGQGKPYEGQNITFNINGMFYTRTTNADGYAALTIRMTAAVNTYTITSSYNGTNIANKITIIP